jgi:hypothetical protein
MACATQLGTTVGEPVSDRQKTARWWESRKTERFWLESTDRADVGADLRAPEVDGGGKPNWRYDLLKEIDLGDIVVHGKKPASQALSVIAMPLRRDDASFDWSCSLNG